MAGDDKTEKATPKKREEARKKGQVARSMDLNGAVVLLAALLALSAFGPDDAASAIGEAMREHRSSLDRRRPTSSSREGVGTMLARGRRGTSLLAVAPIAVVCLVAGVLVNVAQVGFKPSAQALKPDLKKLNPLTGAKKHLRPARARSRRGKTIVKVVAVGGDRRARRASPSSTSSPRSSACRRPSSLPQLAARRCSASPSAPRVAYLVIALVDYVYQRWRHEKQLKMDKQEVKDEHKQQELPAEVKRRCSAAARWSSPARA